MGQGVGFLKVIKSVGTAETSTQVARHISPIFLSSAKTAIHTQIEIPPQQDHALQTHSLKQPKGESMGDVFAIFF